MIKYTTRLIIQRIQPSGGWAYYPTSLCARSYSFKTNNTIDSSKLEFTKRNILIEENIDKYYPSMTDIQLWHKGALIEAKDISIPKFLALFEKANFFDHSQSNYGDKDVYTLNGKIKNIRYSGKKICFIDLLHSSSNSQLQIILNFNRLSQENGGSSSSIPQGEFVTSTQFLKKGDYIKVQGYPGRSESRAGTLSLISTTMPLILSPAQRLLPSKLTDANKIKKNRIVDYQVNGIETLLIRNYIIKLIRLFFEEQSFVEVETPILSSKTNGATAKPFKTTILDSKGETTLELRIAPELWLKRLIISGFEKIYEIGKVFRNESVDATHNPEFTILEFYETFLSLDDLISKGEQLLKYILLNLKNRFPNSKTLLNSNFNGLFETLEKTNWKFRRFDFLSTLSNELNVDFALLNLNNPDPTDIIKVLPTFAKDFLSINAPISTLSTQQIVNKLCSEFLEGKYCNSIHPTLIMHHPTIISPLAKTNTHNSQVSNRFELFVKGKELMNAYEEENCPQYQENNFRLQNSSTLDFHFINSLRYGMPPVGGLGMGIDRLCMLLMNKQRIEDVLPFGTLDDVDEQ
ncbi:lysine--tRNA ligase MSK1 NDAI_0A06670 [Naumovozyma dairenensis CBS 421]|uniref:lysine--tRNA ligase n=1 Tax=Naumovozyma dairenensis (strain ATCC 10597 / BCRC 20456 / CBS 421 / NBRC 0211 / NRRL Y-12639) TaxID=1071378 RepID=G0W4T3_NAUDC|nr:hypothetical protein NDAI_0A06670 [Naumovozyma dairenensis CBS 421]CCD22821.1 hypothetical protein NDAI_0A06670 [Naumovozyma dairenensis CBS 421]